VLKTLLSHISITSAVIHRSWIRTTNSGESVAALISPSTSVVLPGAWRKNSTGLPSVHLGRRGVLLQIRFLARLGRTPATCHRATCPFTKELLLQQQQRLLPSPCPASSPDKGRSQSSFQRRVPPRSFPLLQSLRCPIRAIRATGPLPAREVTALRGTNTGPVMVVGWPPARTRL
jgi:hypothetical protein